MFVFAALNGRFPLAIFLPCKAKDTRTAKKACPLSKRKESCGPVRKGPSYSISNRHVKASRAGQFDRQPSGRYVMCREIHNQETPFLIQGFWCFRNCGSLYERKEPNALNKSG